MAWRDRYRQASFRGATFRIDTASKAGGRRGQTFEFPKRDLPSDEDLGRRAGRWAITGWVIGPAYDFDADTLESTLNQEGHGLLVHPIMGEMNVRCETYTRSERRTEGGMATFDMTFVEAGSDASDMVGEGTQQQLRESASSAEKTVGDRTDARLNETISV